MPEELSFYDVKSKMKFSTTKYKVKMINGRRFAVAKVPGSSHEAYRVLGKKR